MASLRTYMIDTDSYTPAVANVNDYLLSTNLKVYHQQLSITSEKKHQVFQK